MTAMLQVVDAGKVYQPAPIWLRPVIRTAVSEPVPALRGVSLDVAPGEIVGLVGPNGAGKTTLIKLISTLLQPTSGRVAVAGYDTTERPGEVRRRLGLVLEGDQGLYNRLTGRQNLELYGRLSDLSMSEARHRAGVLLEQLDLAGRDKLVFGYSSGMKALLSLARALMANPPLLVLDEPTRSLDPVASRDAMRLFARLGDEGRSVLFSNHRLDEVVTVCTRVAAIVAGTLRFWGRPEELGSTPETAARALSDLLEREAREPS